MVMKMEDVAKITEEMDVTTMEINVVIPMRRTRTS